MTDSYRQNKSPFATALGDWFPLRTYFLTGKASPNDSEIVIVVIIGIGEAQLVLHNGGIIAQTACLDRVFFILSFVEPGRSLLSCEHFQYSARQLLDLNSCLYHFESHIRTWCF
jgi:hypothetical protein